MINDNKIIKIKLSIYMIMLFLFVNFFSTFRAIVYANDNSLKELGGLTPKQWYDKHGSDIVFVPQSQLLVFVNEAKVATSTNVVRFSTIGWQVRFEPKDGSTKYMTWIYPNPVGDQVIGTVVYSAFAIPISPSSNQRYRGSIFECLIDDFGGTITQDYLATKFAQGVDIYFDAIISIKEKGSTETNAIMDADRNVIPNPAAPEKNRGEYYLTKDGTTSLSTNHVVKPGRPKVTYWDSKYGGIKGRGWTNPDGFNDYFNKYINIQKEEVILQKTVQYTHWSKTGERLDPTGKPLIWGLYDIKPGETKQVTVTGLSFPGYKIYKSALNYTGREADNQDIVTGDDAITRTITLRADREHHYVYFYYEPIGDDNEITGQIIFSPNKSADIPGNRENWVNQNIQVQVYVEPSREEVEITSSESRSYRYYDSCYTTREVCTDLDDGSRVCWTECVGSWMDSSISCTFKQTWQVSQLYVTGTGKTADGTTVSIGPFIISNGGTITIDKELKDIRLQARVYKWTPKNDPIFVCGEPPLGYWTKSKPSSNTPEPDATYDSDSGLYYLDKTKPRIDLVNPENTNNRWVNSAVNVEVKASDNLSGFYRTNSYIQVTDKSYYNRPQETIYFSQGNRSENKTISLNQDGIYEISINLEDIAQNKINKATYGEYKIDMTKPYPAKFSDDTRNYIDEDLTITVTVGDNLSGVVETKYVVNNSPSDTSGMQAVSVTTPEGTNGYNSFQVNITKPGSWWIHVYQKDRAGNETWTTSREYKIIRLGHPDNKSGETFTGESDKLWISPLQMNHKIPRATRFDILLKTYGLTEGETGYTTVDLTVPKWVDDDVEKKVNGQYAITSGITTHTMNYYSGYAQGPQTYATPNTVLQWWKAYIAPYGTPVTLDRNGNRLRPKYEVNVQLEFSNYYPNKTHVSTLQFDIIPETKIKTEIIKNQY